MVDMMIHGYECMNEESLEIALKLTELERDHDEDELFPDAFMQEFTAFETWDVFKRLLAATPRGERVDFVARTTRFSCFEEMEGMALERLVARKVARDSLACTARRLAVV